MLSDNERPTQGRVNFSVSPQAKTAALLNPRVAVLFLSAVVPYTRRSFQSVFELLCLSFSLLVYLLSYNRNHSTRRFHSRHSFRKVIRSGCESTS